ncbi:alpha-ketoacid dehydrogenase subunit beta [Mycobacterium sp. C31M]
MKSLTEAQAGPSSTMSMAVALNSALDAAFARRSDVIALGEDIADPAGGVFKVTKGLSTKYGADRVRSTPIAEQAIVGAAIGAALGGYRPVAEIMFFDFITIAMDQIINHAAKLRYVSGGHSSVPITIRTAIGDTRFGPQHSQSLEAWFMHTPGIKVVMPSNPIDAKGLLTACIDDDDPCLFIENVNLMFSVKTPTPDTEYQIPLGSARIVRPGDDVTLITYGAMVSVAEKVGDMLAAEGISTEVIDLRSLVPLDFETVLRSVERTRRAVVLHEATRFCGPGAEIASVITEELFGDLLAPTLRIGGAFSPRPFTPLGHLPDSDQIVTGVRELVTGG